MASPAAVPYNVPQLPCGSGGMADATGLKSVGPKGPWGFESPLPHQESKRTDARQDDKTARCKEMEPAPSSVGESELCAETGSETSPNEPSPSVYRACSERAELPDDLAVYIVSESGTLGDGLELRQPLQ